MAETATPSFHLTPINPPPKQKAPVDHHMVKKRAPMSVPVEPGLPSLQDALSGGSLVSFARPIAEADQSSTTVGIGIEDAFGESQSVDNTENDNNRNQNSRIHHSDEPAPPVNTTGHKRFGSTTNGSDDKSVNESASGFIHHAATRESILQKQRPLVDAISKESSRTHTMTNRSEGKRKRPYVEEEHEQDEPQYKNIKRQQTNEEKIAAGIAALHSQQIQPSISATPRDTAMNPRKEAVRDEENDGILDDTEQPPYQRSRLSESVANAHSVPNIIKR
ncbi:hypothetical protein F5884DRAFT_394554 [Xylogone sp. PMI_703]|nr:hypothetical protein F5884DRAFT_394554 [Xylogone sp. PMI_703]